MVALGARLLQCVKFMAPMVTRALRQRVAGIDGDDKGRFQFRRVGG